MEIIKKIYIEPSGNRIRGRQGWRNHENRCPNRWTSTVVIITTYDYYGRLAPKRKYQLL